MSEDTKPYMYMCGVCFAVYEAEGDLINHIGVWHSTSGVEPWQTDGQDTVHEPINVIDIRPIPDSTSGVEPWQTDGQDTVHEPVNVIDIRPIPDSSQDGNQRYVTCIACNRSYEDGEELRQHMLMHEAEANSASINTLTEPLRLPKPEIHVMKLFDCNACKKKFIRKDDWEKHMNAKACIGENEYKCRTCNKVFSLKSSLINHEKIHQSKDKTGNKRIKCVVCEKMFAQNLFQYHIKLHENDVQRPNTNDVKQLNIVVKQNVKKTLSANTDYARTMVNYECNTCKRIFFSPGTLENHEKMHTLEMNADIKRKIKCAKCASFFSWHLFVHHAKLHEDAEADAQKANKVEAQRVSNFMVPNENVDKTETTKKHGGAPAQKGEPIVICPVGPKEYECKVCKQVYFTRGSLGSHMRTHMQAQKKKVTVKCPKCGNMFSKDLLRYHVRVHNNHNTIREKSGTKDPRRIVQREDVSVAEEVKSNVIDGNEKAQSDNELPVGIGITDPTQPHTITDDGRIKCLDCGFICGTDLFSEHAQAHKNEQSQMEVDRTMPRYAEKTRRSPTPEKIYQCSMCDERFPRKSSLTNHEKSHSGNYHIRCNICNKLFHSDLFQYHIKLHATEDQESTKGDGLTELSMCIYCGKTFTLGNVLVDHVEFCRLQQNGDTTVNPAQDDQDQNAETGGNSASVDESKELGKRLFQCDFCRRFFSTQSKLKSHRARSHQMFECKTCGKHFPSLNKHQLTHIDELEEKRN